MKIRNRIMLWVVSAELVTSLVFSLVIFLEMWKEPLKIADSQLERTASVVAGQLAEGRTPLTDQQAKMLLVSSKHYWIKVYDGKLRPIYRSDLAEAVDIPLYRDKAEGAYLVSARITNQDIGYHRQNDSKVMFRARVIPESIAGSPCLIQIAKPMEDLEEDALHLLAAIGIGLAVSTALLLCLSYFLAGRIVKPIAAINRLSRDINEKTLDKRIPLGTSQDEIHELAKCLNLMFDRLQFSFARQKQLIADASHELKSPIAMLRLFFDEAIQRGDLPEDFRQELDRQGCGVLRMDRLVRTLLELSALEIKASLTMEPFDVVELARSVAADFGPLMEKANINLETEMPDQLEIRGDKDKLRRALINVFDNAVKYTPEEGTMGFIVNEAGEEVRLSLHNTGAGIAKDDIPRVFDQFYRVDKSRSTKYGGAGLGLAIVKQIVRLHQGAVSIESAEGEWTRVDIFLPRHPKEKQQ
jgi:two-component system OmpR family sensor kinase